MFVFSRRKWPQIYHPESFRNEEVFKISEAEIINRCGLDTYLFLRYLQTLTKIFGPLAAVLLSVLIPVNLIGGVGPQGGVHGLDTLSWINVDPKKTARYWAHLCIALVVILWVCHIIGYEIRSYTKVRHRRLRSVERFRNACGTTVLVSDIPLECLKESHLRTLYGVFPGGVKAVSINRDFRPLMRKVQERERAIRTLESVETKLMVKIQNENRGGQDIQRSIESNRLESYTSPFNIQWLPPVPGLSRKVDTIGACRARLQGLDAENRRGQQSQSEFKEVPSAIVRFERPLGAFLASQSTLHTEPHKMTATLVEDPSQIIWENISLTWWERYVRRWILTGISIAIICGCTVPVAFTGLLSQLSYTATEFPWLSWVASLPPWFLSALQGALTPAILAATMITAPLILQKLVLAQGRTSRANAELALQDYYFWFLFLQVFLVISVSSSVATVLSSLKYNVRSFAGLLALNLPKAANYFLSYVVLQSFSVSAGTLLQVGRLAHFIAGPLLGNTARDVWERLKKPQVQWGMFFPVYTNLAVITIIYSVVIPLVLVVSVVAFVSF
ncbi:MAG: hypothetical protein Q9188_006104 [Gyalolechia gomerana]